MLHGPYIVFEGCDGSGKSSVMPKVADAFSERLPILQTRHPGSTPLGAHLRRLLQSPDAIDPTIYIDDLSRQALYMVDTVSFVKNILEPSLNEGTAVFADRSSFISAMVYGLADGLDLGSISRLLQFVTTPKADRLYILRCPWQVARSRTSARDDGKERDHYERRPIEFHEQVQKIYDDLLTTSAEQTVLVSQLASLDDVVYVDATQPLDDVVNDVVRDLDRVLKIRFNV